MPQIFNDRVVLSYLDEGEGDPVVLVHGFASNTAMNWVYPGWVPELTRAGYRVLALDNRGHGESTKLYDPEDYYISAMAGDVLALLDQLDIDRADMMGYSLGSRISAYIAAHHADRVRSLTLGGLGLGLITGKLPSENVAVALEADSITDVTDVQGRMFRAFAEQTHSDRRALAACIRGSRRQMSRDEAASIAVRTLIAVGTTDTVAGSAAALAEVIPHAKVLDIPNRDHMRAVGDRVYKAGVADFLKQRP